MKTWHIHIEGQVQGVGFRPFVYRLAHEFHIMGTVQNSTNGVHIIFNDQQRRAHEILNRIIDNPPPLSLIMRYQIKEIPSRNFRDFTIIASDDAAQPKLMLTPDIALCDNCRRELTSPDNRRFQYPFITCTQCGPRFSIMKKIPYDRANTSMAPFEMCLRCNDEYHDPDDYRYFAQTNSCPDCAIDQLLLRSNGDIISQDNQKIVQETVAAWHAGKIIAIKGIGGFLLTCDAKNKEVIMELRKRKVRPSKPFATMIPYQWFEDRLFSLNRNEQKLLEHFSAPIVLVRKSSIPIEINFAENVAPELNRIGVMLPYTPLFYLLLKEFNQAIVATSGNISHSPIIYTNEDAKEYLKTVADFILLNNRDILIPEDDSVLTVTSRGQKLIYRRSRGMAPTYINTKLDLPKRTILCMGAMLKSNFCYLHEGQPFISQYLGDLENYDTQNHYQNTLDHFLNLFKSKPDLILTDQHPDYPSSRIGDQLSKIYGIPLKKIQHHRAHFAAVLAENNLLGSDRRVLGIIWDGTGLGEDGHIWGGEFFAFIQTRIGRIGALQYFKHFLGDKMSREPRISALAICRNLPESSRLRMKFSPLEWTNYIKILEKDSSLQTSSMGRIFDAVASILDVMDIQSYEGEAAAHLEVIADEYLQSSTENLQDMVYYDLVFVELGTIRVDMVKCIQQIFSDLDDGLDKGLISAKFHYTLVDIIDQVAKLLDFQEIAFSGGVFQNSLLVDLIIEQLSQDYSLFFHRDLSPNDENISFGQLIYHSLNEEENIDPKTSSRILESNDLQPRKINLNP